MRNPKRSAFAWKQLFYQSFRALKSKMFLILSGNGQEVKTPAHFPVQPLQRVAG
jgi:hypothetical protein